MKQKPIFHPPIHLVDNTKLEGSTLTSTDAALMAELGLLEKDIAAQNKAKLEAAKVAKEVAYGEAETESMKIQKRLLNLDKQI